QQFTALGEFNCPAQAVAFSETRVQRTNSILPIPRLYDGVLPSRAPARRVSHSLRAHRGPRVPETVQSAEQQGRRVHPQCPADQQDQEGQCEKQARNRVQGQVHPQAHQGLSGGSDLHQDCPDHLQAYAHCGAGLLAGHEEGATEQGIRGPDAGADAVSIA
ncbi:hypothetical protein B484DRAFT_19600, partial [Ochromonadaceae sp. CCMP2298]